MRQRTTFLHRPGDAVDPALLRISGGSLAGPDISAAREDRVTFPLHQLPDELQALFGDTHKLDIKWVGPRPYEAVSPLFSRLPPGFHLSYSPRTRTPPDSETLCVALRTAFGDVNCSSPKESFTPLTQERFESSATFQYFQPLENLSGFVRYATEAVCPPEDESCAAQVGRLAEAISLDISYETLTRAVKVTARWPYQKQPLTVSSQPFKTEVGVLAEDKAPNQEPQELGLSGLLAVLNQDSAPSPTLFTIPSRHRRAEGTFSAKFLSPTGLHPTLQITLDSNKSPAKDSDCSPYAYLTLPRSIFADKYQLVGEHFLNSKNLTSVRYMSNSVDLEIPEYVTKPWGSALLLEFSPPTTGTPEPWSAEVPLHLRYLAPSSRGYQDAGIPYPAVFWACPAAAGTQFSTNPFDQANLGYDSLFESHTSFWHVDPRPSSGDRLINTVTVPVLDLDKSRWVNRGTAASVIIGFAWIVWKLLARTADPSKSQTAKKGESKKTR